MKVALQVLIVGYGEMGHALESLLRERNRINIWPVTPQHTGMPDEIRQGLSVTDLVCMCVPTVAHPVLLEQLSSRSLHAITLSVAKGVDDDCHTAAEILAEKLEPGHVWGVLCGPMISHEIMSGKLAYAETGMHDPAMFTRVQSFFSQSNLLLDYSPHPEACCWNGVLKNVYAPLFGIIDALGFGDNARGRLLMGVIAEMDVLVERLTGVKGTVYKEAGLADLMTTITSPTSHHRALGRRVAHADVRNMQCEGFHTLVVMKRRQRITTADLPLYEIVSGLVTDPLKVPETLHTWLQAPPVRT